MDAPPRDTIRAPVPTDVAFVAFVVVRAAAPPPPAPAPPPPLTFPPYRVPPTYKSPRIDVPPSTRSAPVPSEIAGAIELIKTGPPVIVLP